MLKPAIATVLAASIMFGSVALTYAAPTNIHPKMDATDVPRPLKSLRKQRKAPTVETIRVGCPEGYDVTIQKARPGRVQVWLYGCPSTGVSIEVPTALELGDARVSGAKKGDKDGGWYR